MFKFEKRNRIEVDDLIEDVRSLIQNLDPNEENYSAQYKNYLNLLDSLSNIKKLEDADNEERRKEKIQMIQFAVTTGISIFSILVGIVMFNRGMKFEETGTFTSSTFKRFWNDKTFKKV